jgi:transposase
VINMDARQQKGLQIAQTSRIKRGSNYWVVPSQSGRGSYKVRENGHGFLCNCPDCELRKTKCKHQWAVEYTIKKIVDEYGNMTTEKSMKITYTQDWSAYNKAQMNEKSMFMKLLYDLCNEVPNPDYTFGRPMLPLSDMVFASALKVYTTFSLRRFTSDMREAKGNGHIEKVPYYSTVSRYMNKKEMTPILHNLIKMTSLPLASVEHDFAVDSSGFSTTRFARYYSFKHGKDRKYRTWVKCHIACGTKTNVVTGVEITEETASDCPQFKPLIEKTAENFQIGEVSADKAYSSRENHEIVGDFGGMAYIPFRTNATGRAGHSALWKKMFHFYNLHRDEFLQHYHKRSNVETVFHMVKTKFGDSVRSKERTAQVNEVLLKFLCHNICVLIQEMHEMEMEMN